MTRSEFLSQMAKVAANPEAKKAVEEATTREEFIQAVAQAGVTVSEKDLQKVAAWETETRELSDSELDAASAAGFMDWVQEHVIDWIMKPFYDAVK